MGKIAPSPRTEKKRQLILDTSLKVFAREGFAETDVQVIADLAKVGKGTIYRHFGNKRELFLATARHCVERLAEFIREQVKENPSAEKVLREVASAYARYYELHPEAVEIMIQERASFREQVFPTHLMHRAETRADFEAFLRGAMEQGELRQVEVADVTNAFADLLYGSVVSGCLEGAKGQLAAARPAGDGHLLAWLAAEAVEQPRTTDETNCDTARPSRSYGHISWLWRIDDECSRDSNRCARKMQVELVVAEVKALDVSSDFTGNLLPRRRTIVVSEVDGVVREIPAVGLKIDVEVNGERYVEQLGIGYGHEVKQNDVLVVLDSVDFELELAVARAKVAKAAADLANLRAWERPETIERLTALRDEATARHEQALAELERSKSLGNAISQSDHDARRTDVTTTRAMLVSHEASLRIATAGPTKEEVAVQQALLDQAEAEVKQKERDLEKATIRAPYDAVVTDMYVEVGARVSAASGQILELMDLRFLVAEVGVPEAYMNRVQLQDRATVHIAGATEPVPGLVVSINDKLDPESRSFRVRVAIDNIERRFKAGQFARVKLNVGNSAQHIVIPTESITFSEGQPGVFAYNAGRVTRRSITIGVSNDWQTEVLDGLTAGTPIVVDDPTLLADGMQVDVRELSRP